MKHKIYMIDLTYFSKKHEASYSAMSKPRTDTVETLIQMGASIKWVKIFERNHGRIANAILHRINIVLVYI